MCQNVSYVCNIYQYIYFAQVHVATEKLEASLQAHLSGFTEAKSEIFVGNAFLQKKNVL